MRYCYEHKYQLAREFANNWKTARAENSDAKSFWDAFFRIFNLDRFRIASFEYRIKHRSGTTKFADVFWRGKLLCEHKSKGKDLDAAFEQALSYIEEIRRQNPADVPSYVIVSDFARMELHDLRAQNKISFSLDELPQQIKLRNFDFMDGIQDELKAAQEKANIDAANSVGNLYKTFNTDDNIDKNNLKQFFIRLLFCFFADDTLIFNPNQFEEYLKKFTREDGMDTGGVLDNIFTILNTSEKQRQKNIPEELGAFPYVNGQLFKERLNNLNFNAEQRAQLFSCMQRDWSEISPEIFGSLFQSVMDKDDRRALGAHYTEEANILKVIDSLFMDDLRAKFEAARAIKTKAAREKALGALHEHIANLQFLDPACGCGNFLIVAYRELRHLEDEILAALFPERKQMQNVATLVRVKISQFHGIELEAYPAQIAKVAMWLSDHQCNRRTAARFGETRPTIPLHDAAEIICDNALKIDWPAADFIFGNPPFIGGKYQSPEQKTDMQRINGHIPSFGLLDYVCNWHVKAAGIMKKTPAIKAAFVSTNSICQGEQVGVLWGWLLKEGFEIIFAHRTFQWMSQAQGKAAVHCIIVGFCLENTHNGSKKLFLYPDIKEAPNCQTVENINPYLVAANNAIIERRNKPLCNVPEMVTGNKPIDDGNYLFKPDEKTAFLAKEPNAAPYFKRWIGGDEMLNNIERWVLWLGDIEPQVLANLPECRKRIQAVRDFRAASKSKPTQVLADYPRRFHTNFIPQEKYLALPQVSSENRHFIPISYLSEDVLCSDKLRIIEGGDLFHLGILSSTMHMAWVRTVTGRLKSDYQYSAKIVYNNFPWPLPLENKLRTAIENKAQAVLDARAQYPKATLAELYQPETMPNELIRAHAQLDKAVDAAYGYTGSADDAPRVAFLFELYSIKVQE